jgi:starch synthase
MNMPATIGCCRAFDYLRDAMQILIAASEAVPFAKTGGLADVASGLSLALADRGHQVTLMLPYYRQLIPEKIPRRPTGRFVEVPLRGQRIKAGIVESRLGDSAVRVLLIDNPYYFDRPSLYMHQGRDYPDNCERFCIFSRAVMEAARIFKLNPDVIHANDWQTGLMPALLQMEYRGKPGFERAAAVLTVHNLAFQGSFWGLDMPLTGLDPSLFNWRQMEHHGNLNLLKTGIVFSDAVTTVSPSYAREIQTPEFGCGLEGVLQHAAGKLTGILNGVDTDSWDPATDTALPAHFDATTVHQGKPQCKRALQEQLGLEVRGDVPLLGMISRLTDQKGLDLIAANADALLHEDLQLVFLGTGEKRYEALLVEWARRAPQKVAAVIGFDEPLSRRIEAGADLFLMPSRFEPCGLNQMYSMRYGTIPLVHRVGGLADSVTDCTDATLAAGTATGFQFSPYEPAAFLSRLRDALGTYRRPHQWSGLIRSGMKSDWSWSRSAGEYERVYESARP